MKKTGLYILINLLMKFMLKFKKEKEGDYINTNNTRLQGYYETTYEQLKKVFGEPSFSAVDEAEKVSAEWVLEFEDGTIATIQDIYTSGVTPLDNYKWRIHGHSKKAVEYVERIMYANETDSAKKIELLKAKPKLLEAVWNTKNENDKYVKWVMERLIEDSKISQRFYF